MTHEKWPEKKPTNIPYERDDSVNRANEIWNDCLALCTSIRDRERKELSEEKIAKTMFEASQGFKGEFQEIWNIEIQEFERNTWDNCDDNLKEFIKYLAHSIHSLIGGEANG
jgi:hypothetical protein